MLLCSRPEAMLDENGTEYLFDCIHDGVVHLPTILFLLDHYEVNVGRDIVDCTILCLIILEREQYAEDSLSDDEDVIQ